MQSSRLIGMLFVCALCACSPKSGEGMGVQSEPVPRPSRSSEAKEGNPKMESKDGFIQAAIEATSDSAGEVVLVEVARPIAVVIRYRKGDIQNAPSTCSVSIVEEARGKEGVAANDSILGCSLVSSAEEVKARVKMSVEKDAITISDEGDKGNSEFDLYREPDGVWYMARASFTYPEEDPASGDVIVINEAVAFQPGIKTLRFSDYSYDAIKGGLSRAVVE